MKYNAIFENEAIIAAVFSGVISVILLIFQWIKSARDLKKKNKELGYWMKNWERKKSFIDSASKMYLGMAIIFFMGEVLKIILLLIVGEVGAYILSGFIYYMISTIFVFRSYKKSDRNGELWNERKSKIEFITVLYMIYSIAFWIEKFGTHASKMEILVIGVLLYVGIRMLKFHETIYVLDKRYADIYVNNCEKIELVEAGNIKKQGEWIVVYKTSDKGVEEIRIKESDICRINYYGEPLITYKPEGLFKRKEKVK